MWNGRSGQHGVLSLRFHSLSCQLYKLTITRARLVGQHVFCYFCLCCCATVYVLLHTNLFILNSWTDLSKALKSRLSCDSCSSVLACEGFLSANEKCSTMNETHLAWRRATSEMGVSTVQRSTKYTCLVSTFVDNSDFRFATLKKETINTEEPVSF